MEPLTTTLEVLRKMAETDGAVNFGTPQVLVVGSKTSGKSSLLEAFAKASFMPRGNDLVLRRPLLLHLVQQQMEGESKVSAKFNHSEEVFSSIEDVKRELTRLIKVSMHENQPGSEEIVLSISSPDVPTISLVELPCLFMKSKTSLKEIKRIALRYAANLNTIIAVVLAADENFATSSGYRLAQQADPEGERSLAVLTKLDLSGKTHVVEALYNGALISLKLGIFAMLGRTEEEIQNNMSITSKQEKENNFFRTNYPNLASTMGSVSLVNDVLRLLSKHLLARLPHLRGHTFDLLKNYEDNLEGLRPIPPQDTGVLYRHLIDIVSKFVTIYEDYFKSPEVLYTRSELGGSARLFQIFNEDYHIMMQDIDYLSGVTEEDLNLAIEKSCHKDVSMFPYEKAFQMITKQQMRLLVKPSILCVQLVHVEMVDTVHKCLEQLNSHMTCFPNISCMILRKMEEVLNESSDRTIKAVETLILCHEAYINNRHPDFFKDIHDITFGSNTVEPNSPSDEEEDAYYSPQENEEHLTDNFDVLSITDVDRYSHVEDAPRSGLSRLLFRSSNRGRRQSTSSKTSDTSSSKTTHKSLERIPTRSSVPITHTRSKKKSVHRQAPPPPEVHNSQSSLDSISYATTSPSSTPAPLPLSLRSYTKNNIIFAKAVSQHPKKSAVVKFFIGRYMDAMIKSVEDLVPKMIMNYLVNASVEKTHAQLMGYMLTPSRTAVALQESEDFLMKRKNIKKILTTLQEVYQKLEDIYDDMSFNSLRRESLAM